MFRSVFRIAARSLVKNKFFSAINIIGLSAGLSCCLLIGLYVQHELSYDDFQEKGYRITRVIMEYNFGQEMVRGNFTSTKVAPAFKHNFPEVESAARLYMTKRVVKSGEKLFNENGFLYADSSFFDLFSFPLLRGDTKTVLASANKVVLTASTAKKYFGNEDPVGKMLNIGADEVLYEVTGIVADCPSASQIRFDFLASFSSFGPAQQETYFNANYTTYLLLRKGTVTNQFQEKVTAFMKKEAKAEGENVHINFILEPMKKIHLYSPYDGFEPNNNISYILIIIAVGLLILVIACFTYINLATARSLERAKEVGIRKTIGALKNQIFWQFIGESVLVSLTALLVSILIVVVVLPAFNELAGKSLSVSALFKPAGFLICISFLTIISLFAGSYPAMILARFQPIAVLKGSLKNSGTGIRLRQSLVVFQFVITVFLIAATLIIKNQLNYIQNKNLGYERENVLIMPMDKKMLDHVETIKSSMYTIPSVKAIATAVDAPTHIDGGYTVNKPELPGFVMTIKANPVDEGFIKTTGLELISGTDFSLQDVKDVDTGSPDSAQFHFIINQTAAAKLGWSPKEAVNKKLLLGMRKGIVKGVVKDFHFESLHNSIGPLLLFADSRSNTLLVKTTGNDMANTIAQIEKVWKKIAPHRPFEYHFLNEDFQKMYNAELRLGKVLQLFSALAILLACLGLIGLSAFTAQQRLKEIGIRKVLGASIPDIVGLLSKDFVKLAVIAIVIAIPVAWWATHSWLESFAYRIDIGWGTFVIAALIAILITLFSVGFQAVKAAIMNPVNSLKEN